MTSRDRGLAGLILVAFVLLVRPQEAWLLGLAALVAPFATLPRLSLTAGGVTLLVALSGDPLPLGVLGVVLLIAALRSSSLSLHGVRWRRGRASG